MCVPLAFLYHIARIKFSYYLWRKGYNTRKFFDLRSRMKRMVLGKTGIEAVKLAFGGIPIQRVSETQAIEVVLHALGKGMDFIDTSRMYTSSEGRIGKALQEYGKKVT